LLMKGRGIAQSGHDEDFAVLDFHAALLNPNRGAASPGGLRDCTKNKGAESKDSAPVTRVRLV